MLNRERNLEPLVNYWQAYGKHKFISDKIQEICSDIASKAEITSFHEIYDLLYEHIEDDILKFKDKEGEDYDI